MKLKNSLRQALNHLKPTMVIVTLISYSVCLADISLASGRNDMNCPESHHAVESGDSNTVLFEENGLEMDLQQSVKIILPNGEGIKVTLVPFSLTKIDSLEVENLLQDRDTFGNTIVVSDTCEVIGIIAVLLASACLIFPEPILCTIAAVMQGLFRLLCQ